jgi:Ni,Fe-hydrogenase III component G
MILKSREIKVGDLLQQVKKYFDEGYRFVTATCVREDSGYKIIYTFEKDYNLENIHIIAEGMEIPSISEIYFCAMLVENEIQDFFGLEFIGLPVDFKGKMLLGEDSPACPLASVEVIRKGDKA